jgi:hypothetical protein
MTMSTRPCASRTTSRSAALTPRSSGSNPRVAGGARNSRRRRRPTRR